MFFYSYVCFKESSLTHVFQPSNATLIGVKILSISRKNSRNAANAILEIQNIIQLVQNIQNPDSQSLEIQMLQTMLLRTISENQDLLQNQFPGFLVIIEVLVQNLSMPEWSFPNVRIEAS